MDCFGGFGLALSTQGVNGAIGNVGAETFAVPPRR